MQQYLQPDLDGHKVAYSDGRFWIIHLEHGRTFECYDREIAEYAVWDGGEGYVIAYASASKEGGFDYWIPYGQHELHYHCESLEELGPSADREGVKLYENE